MSLASDDAQYRILKARPVRQHFSQLFSDGSDLRLNPRFALRVYDEGLEHTAGEGLLRGGGRGKIE